MNFGWLTGYMTPTAREGVLEHSGQVDSAIGEPPLSSRPDLLWPPRCLTADADDPGHSRNCSRSAACPRRSIRQPWAHDAEPAGIVTFTGRRDEDGKDETGERDHQHHL